MRCSRGRWLRGSQEPDAVVLPSLALYIDVAQHLGHIRAGEPHLMAAIVWWTLTGTMTGLFKHDQNKEQWSLGALKRMLFTQKALELDADNFEVDVVDPTSRIFRPIRGELSACTCS
jgi:hypothetical protein